MHKPPPTHPPHLDEWVVERWLDDASVRGIEYSGYWNDEEAEREKPFHVVDGNFSRLESYLASIGLPADLEHCLAAIGSPLSGRGIDLAAGALWAAPQLLRTQGIERLFCLEFSRHRLLTIGPLVLEHYRVDPQRVVLAYGSFYDLHLNSDSLDFAFMSQAFHHAEDPGALLAELRRVLKPDGVVIIIGEHLIRPASYAKFAARAALSLTTPASIRRRLLNGRRDVRGTLRPLGDDIIPRDPVLGDHVYTHREYRRLFEEGGFTMRRLRRRGGHYQSFLLKRA